MNLLTVHWYIYVGFGLKLNRNMSQYPVAKYVWIHGRNLVRDGVCDPLSFLQLGDKLRFVTPNFLTQIY